MPEVVRTVGRYGILRELGRGGMAVVYLARQVDLDRLVALKELAAFHAADADFARRFVRESRLGILAAIRAWDPDRSVPFRCFAWLCALREANTAVNAARAAKHQPLNQARSLHRPFGEDGAPLEETLVATRECVVHAKAADRPRRLADCALTSAIRASSRCIDWVRWSVTALRAVGGTGRA